MMPMTVSEREALPRRPPAAASSETSASGGSARDEMPPPPPLDIESPQEVATSARIIKRKPKRTRHKQEQQNQVQAQELQERLASGAQVASKRHSETNKPPTASAAEMLAAYCDQARESQEQEHHQPNSRVSARVAPDEPHLLLVPAARKRRQESSNKSHLATGTLWLGLCLLLSDLNSFVGPNSRLLHHLLPPTTSTRSSWLFASQNDHATCDKRQQCQPPPTGTGLIMLAKAADAHATNMAPPYRYPRYRIKPEPHVVITKGSNYVFRCQLAEPMDNHWWYKDGDTLLFANDTKPEPENAERLYFVGNVNDFDYSIEIRNATEDDAGRYGCQTNPHHVNPLEIPTKYTIYSQLQVLDEPFTTATATTTTITPSSPSNYKHNLNSTFSSTISASGGAASLVVNNQTPNLIQAPLSQPTMQRLPPPTRLFASTTASQSNGLSSSSLPPGGSTLGLSLPIFWPYLLLALAALLMLTNIYLIYSIIKRHARRGAGTTTTTTTSDSSSSSGGCSTKSTSKENSPMSTNTSEHVPSQITVSPQPSPSPPTSYTLQHHQQQQQQQLQLSNNLGLHHHRQQQQQHQQQQYQDLHHQQEQFQDQHQLPPPSQQPQPIYIIQPAYWA